MGKELVGLLSPLLDSTIGELAYFLYFQPAIEIPDLVRQKKTTNTILLYIDQKSTCYLYQKLYR